MPARQTQLTRLPARSPSRRELWWEREGLVYRGDTLWLGRTDVQQRAEAAEGPLYLYDGERVLKNLRRLRKALAGAVPQGRICYAMKANRHPDLLAALRVRGRCGVDVCSPGELRLAREMGFGPALISYTGTSMSEQDATELARHPGVAINCDSRSSLRRVARLMPGRRVGLRLNPGMGIGYRQNPRLVYAGGQATKFGIPLTEVEEALREARSLGLTVEGLHVHAGCGFLSPQLPRWDRIVARLAAVAREQAGLRYLNLGGGLGIPLVPRDRPLDLVAWAEVVAKHCGNATYEVWIEPGDYLVKDAGVLVLTVTEVEHKAGTWFLGVDGGFNLHPEPVFYQLPLEPVPVIRREGGRRSYTLAGNINEAHDLWARNVRLPRLEPGAKLAFLNAGGYGAAMASDHCRRGEFDEEVVWG